MSRDLLSDFLSKVKNAYMRGKLSLETENTRTVYSLCAVLKDSGYIKGFNKFKEGGFSRLHIDLLYKDGKPVLLGIRRVSKSGRRVYMGRRDLKPVLGGLGICILTTSRGLISNLDARKRKLGGEVLCEVW